MVNSSPTTCGIAEAAKHFGISTEAVRQRIRRKKLEAYKTEGGVWQIVLPSPNGRTEPVPDSVQVSVQLPVGGEATHAYEEPMARTRRPRRSSADSRSSTCPHARRRWRGPPRSPPPAGVSKRYGRSCPTRTSSRRPAATSSCPPATRSKQPVRLSQRPAAPAGIGARQGSAGRATTGQSEPRNGRPTPAPDSRMAK